MSRQDAVELRDRLRAMVHRLLHERDLQGEIATLGVVLPWDIGREVEGLRTILGRALSDATYSADQAVADARALGVEVADPNPLLDSWREAEASCRRHEEKYRAEFARTGLRVGATYELTNGDHYRIDGVDYALGACIDGVDYALGAYVRGHNLTINYAWPMELWDLMRKIQREGDGPKEIK